MNKHIHLIVSAASLLSMTAIACDDDCDDNDSGRLCYFSKDETVLGKSHEEWIIEWWQFLMSHDCETLPLAGTEIQDGPVHFLSGSIGEGTYEATIRDDQYLLVPVINYINDYPCPDTAFHPAPGQSLEDFLKEGAAGVIDGVSNPSLSLDGKDIPIGDAKRILTGMFTFTGNAAIAGCLDPCVTGSPQQAASDGYWVMFCPLSPGTHTLLVKGKLFDYVLSNTYTIHVE